jgi:uncharacterized membrane-anchored protein
VKVSPGYRFADAQQARIFLEGIKQPVPTSLVGIVAPAAGGGWVALEYSPIGYVADADKDRIDATSLLKSLSSRASKSRQPQSAGAVAKADWEIKPTYDSDAHALEWAVRTEGRNGAQAAVNHTMRLLGRHGVLDAVMSKGSTDSGDSATLKQLVKGISFKEGEAYADFKNGDKLAVSGVAATIATDIGASAGSDSLGNADGEGSSTFFWIGIAVVACAGLGGTVLLLKKFKQHKSHAAAAHSSAPIVAHANTVPPVNGSKSKINGSRAPVGAIMANGHGHGPNGNNKRRRMFNYHKFYTEMVLQGPTPSIGVDNYGGLEMESYRQGRHAAESESAASNNGHHGAVLNANSELIANQKALIEEQTRLIDQQAKLIEEKSRLIAEKNQLLKRQSELIDNSLL